MRYEAPPPREIPLSQAPSFIIAMELGLRNGDDAFLQKAAPLLQGLIDRIQREVYDLSELQYRACCLRDEYTSATGAHGPVESEAHA